MSKYKLGMLLFIGSEAMFFAMLIISYIYYHGKIFSQEAALPRTLDVPFTAIFTVLLLSSSLTIWLAEYSLRHGSRMLMQIWLFVTIALGVAFLGGQAFEYHRLLSDGITLHTGLFGTTFYTITGFHGLHVTLGLILLLLVLGFSRRFRAPHSEALGTVSYYWHFVDVVWIFVFSIIYLWTYFS